MKIALCELRSLIREVLTTCPKCGGRKELDFGFYKRDCEKCEGSGQVDDGKPNVHVDAPTQRSTPTSRKLIDQLSPRFNEFRKVGDKHGFTWTLQLFYSSLNQQWNPGFYRNGTNGLDRALYYDGTDWRDRLDREVPFPDMSDPTFIELLDEYLAGENYVP